MSENHEFLFNKGKDSYDRGNYQYAAELFRRALDLKIDFPDCRRCLHLAKHQLAKQQKKKSPFSDFLTLCQSLPPFAAALFYRFRGDRRQYIKSLEKMISCRPLSGKALTEMGEAFAVLQMNGSAKAIFNEIHAKAPKNIVALRYLARLYFQEGDLENALKISEKALEISPGDPVPTKIVKDVHAQRTIDKTFDKTDDSDFRIKF